MTTRDERAAAEKARRHMHGLLTELAKPWNETPKMRLGFLVTMAQVALQMLMVEYGRAYAVSSAVLAMFPRWRKWHSVMLWWVIVSGVWMIVDGAFTAARWLARWLGGL